MKLLNFIFGTNTPRPTNKLSTPNFLTAEEERAEIEKRAAEAIKAVKNLGIEIEMVDDIGSRCSVSNRISTSSICSNKQ